MSFVIGSQKNKNFRNCIKEGVIKAYSLVRIWML